MTPVARTRPTERSSQRSLRNAALDRQTRLPATVDSSSPFSWSSQYQYRRQAAARFGKSVFDLPIARRVRDVLLNHVRDGDQVLEVGAGDRRMADLLRARRPNTHYESLDPDPQGTHDYTDWSQVQQTYDVVFAFEVVEHIAWADLPGWLGQVRAALRPGGLLLLSTPNTFYPPAYLRDATHRTPLCYDELAGLVEASGFRVGRLLRIYHDPVHRKLLRRYLLGWLFRLLGIDYARQIVLVAHRDDVDPFEQTAQAR